MSTFKNTEVTVIVGREAKNCSSSFNIEIFFLTCTFLDVKTDGSLTGAKSDE